MVRHYSSVPLNTTFAALADPTRRAILGRLAEGATSVGALAAPFRMSGPAITKHLKVLERAKLVRREVDGRVHRMHLEAAPMREAQAWIDRYRKIWERQFDALSEFLERTAPEHAKGKKGARR